jgi:hypothetical protein
MVVSLSQPFRKLLDGLHGRTLVDQTIKPVLARGTAALHLSPNRSETPSQIGQLVTRQTVLVIESISQHTAVG